jgi:hypothetical protein
MKSFDLAIAQLYSLPTAARVEIVTYIEQKYAATRMDRIRALEETSACLNEEEGEILSRSIRACCERVDDE